MMPYALSPAETHSNSLKAAYALSFTSLMVAADFYIFKGGAGGAGKF